MTTRRMRYIGAVVGAIGLAAGLAGTLPASARPNILPPQKPAAPSVVAYSDDPTAIQVSWTRTDPLAAGYVVERHKTGPQYTVVGTNLPLAPLGGGMEFTDHVATAPSASHTYAYRVCAFNPGGETCSDYTSIDHTTPHFIPIPPVFLLQPDLTVSQLFFCSAQAPFVGGFQVQNTGIWDAGPFRVAVLAGAQSYSIDVPGLAAGGEQTYWLTSVDYGAPVAVLVDADHQVSESNELNNSIGFDNTCFSF